MYMKSEDVPVYNTHGTNNISEGEVIAKALQIIERRLNKPGEAMSSPDIVKNLMTIKIADREHEMFATIFLDAQHRVLQYREMFRGTLNQTSVYPREVVKEALRCNAGAVIFAHNHPSGMPEPSRADETLTQTLKNTLALVDVKVLDHIIVGGMDTVSFTERGLL